MKNRVVVAALCVILAALILHAQRPAPDTLAASGGAITIIPITHGTLQIEHGAHVILIDPARFGPGSTDPPPPLPRREAEVGP